MGMYCVPGDWVEIHRVILEPGQRSSDVPPDTALCPLECWIRGIALTRADLGEKVQIRTMAGRVVSGTLTKVNPGYDHSFGPNVPELVSVHEELRRALREEQV